jgi:hypothetical protein
LREQLQGAESEVNMQRQTNQQLEIHLGQVQRRYEFFLRELEADREDNVGLRGKVRGELRRLGEANALLFGELRPHLKDI